MIIPRLIRLAALALLCVNAQAANLRLYTEENPPINFSRNGQPVGLSVDVVKELLKRTHTMAKMEIVPWARGYRMALSTPNVGLFVAVRTPEREKLFKWVGPVSTSSTSFYSKLGSGMHIASLDEARAVAHIAVPREWYSHQILRSLGFSNLDLVPDPHDMANMTLHGRVPLMVYEDQTLPSLLAELHEPITAVERVYTFMKASNYIVFSLGTPDQVVQRWQQALDGMKRDGSFARIHAQWLPNEKPPGLVAEPDLIPAR